MRAIDADDFIEKLATVPLVQEAMRKAVNQMPTIEPRKGKWIKISPASIYECSVCGQNVMTNDIKAYKFCHGCGAYMKGEEDEEP